MTRGLFISVEGIDGAGKSTHVQFIANYLQQHGLSVVTTREPGGTVVGEKIRDILLHSDGLHEITELLLMFASRQELIHNLIMPNLDRGTAVVSDRFIDASVAYQGMGRKIGMDKLNKIISLLEPLIIPDLTLLFDTPLDVAMARLARSRNKDRIENEDEKFFVSIQQAYHDLAHKESDRIKIISTDRPLVETQHEILIHLDRIISHHAG